MSRVKIGNIMTGLGAVCLGSCAGLLGARALVIREASAVVDARWAAQKGVAGEMVYVGGATEPPPFFLDKTEVTVAAYRACVQAGACTESGRGRLCNGAAKDRDDHPINCVDHDQAAAFCAWAGRRLPTEREWDYAACEFGDELPGIKAGYRQPDPRPQLAPGCYARHAVYDSVGRWSRLKTPPQGTCPVMEHPGTATPGGVFGMTDNVAEWTATEARPGSRRYPNLGGDWEAAEPQMRDLRCSRNRRAHPPSYRDDSIGFRCARSEHEPLWAAALK